MEIRLADSGIMSRIDSMGMIKELSKLPREMVHLVLNDLPLATILQLVQSYLDLDNDDTSSIVGYRQLPGIAEAEAAYFDQCILTHLKLRAIFPSIAELHRLASIWSVYSTVQCVYERGYMDCWSTHVLSYNVWSDLGLSASLLRRTPSALEISLELTKYMCSLLKAWEPSMKHLAMHIMKQLPSHLYSKTDLLQAG